MPLSIKNAKLERIARQLAKETGETMTEAILKAIDERLKRITGRGHPLGLADQLDEIARRCSALPVIDKRKPEELLGYDQHGLPH